jgi:1-deoxy-D-xylulose 5-phosphate reductoisomerase
MSGNDRAGLTAAEEEAVGALPSGEIGFTELSPIVVETLGKLDVYFDGNEETAVRASAEARRICRGLIDTIKRK